MVTLKCDSRRRQRRNGHDKTPYQTHLSLQPLPSTSTSTDREKLYRAWTAASRRHSKANLVRRDSQGNFDAIEASSASFQAGHSKKQRLREKNRRAATRCRPRQKKEVQNIKSKCDHLTAANKELKRQACNLSFELNGLRASALEHQSCDCLVASYNHNQARRVVANLYALDRMDNEVLQRQHVPQ